MVKRRLDKAQLGRLAAGIDGSRAETTSASLSRIYAESRATDTTVAAAVLLATAYPALEGWVANHPADLAALLPRLGDERTVEALEARLGARLAETTDVDKALRKFANAERARIALRELLPAGMGGADVDVTAAELSRLAEVTIEAAYREAYRASVARFGEPRTQSGELSRFTVLGMGKLGGSELNAGSDVDLVYFYDTDDGAAGTVDLHELWSRVARRLTQILETVTEDGFVWRVDLRLRPEGGRGPLVNSLVAAERYYESFGRLWERAALLRARPIAGDRALGATLLDELAPFVWRRSIDPKIASEMMGLVIRSRAELSLDASRDLKLGVGGIREAEFFVQTLQLIWGGRDPSLRTQPTLESLRRLEAKGFVTTLEAAEVADAYLGLRRAEHAVQLSQGVQTHLLPEGGPELERVARSLGFRGSEAMLADLDRHRENVHRRILSLLPELPRSGSSTEARANATRTVKLVAALERNQEDLFAEVAQKHLAQVIPDLGTDDVMAFAKNLWSLGRHPDAVLGTRTRERFPMLTDLVLDAIFEAADPTLAARHLRGFFERARHSAVYTSMLGGDPALVRRVVATLGASAFVGEALARSPELGDIILFSRDVPTATSSSQEVFGAWEAARAQPDVDDEAILSALRIAKGRALLKVALADLAGELTVRGVGDALTAVADASLEVAVRHALGGDVTGFAVVAMGKLGGREISYGSDLDVLFVYDTSSGDAHDKAQRFTRAARKILSLLTTFHGSGPGYEVDVRLRPSGNQGLLVTSLEAFARYHGFEHPDDPRPTMPKRAETWERMALTRARFAAGDAALGERALALVEGALASDGLQLDPLEVDRIRRRVEEEASSEGPTRFDVKLGRGGLLDIEFIAQFLSLSSVATTPTAGRSIVADTSLAIVALEGLDLLTEEEGEVLREAYRFLRRLELRIRVVRADASHVLDLRSPLLASLARRMGVRDRPDVSARDALIERCRATASGVRRVYERVFGASAPVDTAGA